MSWKQSIVVRILLLVAQMFTDDDWARKEINNLSNHILFGERKSAVNAVA